MPRYLVTPALPYANGPIHIGHLVEHVQVSTYVRALRMAGEQVLAVCGADSHGAPIELAALRTNRQPQEVAAEYQASHQETFKRYLVEYDGGYGSTHTEENARHAARIYQALKDGGHIARRDVEQLRDPTDGRFLSDRFVKGTCPKCKAAEQYGDSCESCGSTYRATELIDPKSVVSGATPTLAKSEHLFVKLADFQEQLKALLLRPGFLDEGMRHFLQEWFKEGLKDWDISRDGPYFGFPIPGESNKFFYVWLDAPIGYVSLTERALPARNWQDWWQDPQTQVHHFIGKDILYFHTLFWPAMLMAAGDTLPTAVHVHGMLTVAGSKMSKSRGTFINADDFALLAEPQALRYYFAAKLTASCDDIDLSFEDFVNRVNADLVNNVVNLVSRTLPQLHKVSDGEPGAFDDAAASLVHDARTRLATVEGRYRALDFQGAVRAIVEVATTANKYMQDTAPWEVAKTDAARAQRILTTALWVGKSCLALLKPVLPGVVAILERTLRLPEVTFQNALDALTPGVAVLPYERLFERLDLDKVKSVVQPTGAPVVTTTSAPPAKAAKAKEPPPEIGIDDFMKVDLRAAKVLSAAAVEGSDKLIAVKLDVGSLGTREIFAGLRPHVAPEALLGRMVVVVANLAPRKMKFGVSSGMMLAAGEVPVPLFVDGAAPGDRIR